jgi:hypothetical protein
VNNLWKRLLIAAALILPCAIATADDLSYTEGSVSDVSYIRTKPGKFDAYMHYLATEFKKEMEEFKKAGIILSYGVYAATPKGPGEPDIILVTEYKNMAALDDLRAKTDPIDSKIWGSVEGSNKAFGDREAIREVLGSEFVRELKLK